MLANKRNDTRSPFTPQNMFHETRSTAAQGHKRTFERSDESVCSMAKADLIVGLHRFAAG